MSLQHTTTTLAPHPQSHKGLVDGVQALARRVQGDRELSALIRRKFAIKNTTGYSLNALVDFPVDNPIEIIKHLMIGSEGTLGFVSQATYNTVPDWPHKASAFIMFPDVYSACKGASVLRDQTTVCAMMCNVCSMCVYGRVCETKRDAVSLCCCIACMVGCTLMATWMAMWLPECYVYCCLRWTRWSCLTVQHCVSAPTTSRWCPAWQTWSRVMNWLQGCW